jgi:hypothetical protein
MINWSIIISAFGLAFTGFAYAWFLFILISGAPVWATAIMMLGTVAINWLLFSSLPTVGIWAATFASSVPTIFFLGNVLPESALFASAIWWVGTLSLAIVSEHKIFDREKTLLIFSICTVFFTVSIYLSLIGLGYLWGGKNLFEGSATKTLPLFNKKVEIYTNNPKQLYLNGKTGRLKQIKFYHVVIQLDSGEEVSVWWQDVKKAPKLKLN